MAKEKTASTVQKQKRKFSVKWLLLLSGVASIGLLAIGAIGYVVYDTFFAVASSEEVCEKFIDIAKYELSVTVENSEQLDNVVEGMMGTLNECIEEDKEYRKEVPKSEVKRYTNCVMDAETLQDLTKCDAWDE